MFSMNSDVRRYPLHWPDGVPRTPTRERSHSSRYQVSETKAVEDLLRSVCALHVDPCVLSTNAKLRRDGYPYANQRVDDPGVALYFTRSGQDLVIACDRYVHLRDNYRALGLTLEGLRTIERAGCTDLLDRAFQGYARLPQSVPPAGWRRVLGVSPDATLEDVKRAYKRLVKERHPDVQGGTTRAFIELEAAYNQALTELLGFGSDE